MVDEGPGYASAQGPVVFADPDLPHVFWENLADAARLSVDHSGDVGVDEDIVDIEKLLDVPLFRKSTEDRLAAGWVCDFDAVAQGVAVCPDHVGQADVGESVVPVPPVDIAVHTRKPDLGDSDGSCLVSANEGRFERHTILVE